MAYEPEHIVTVGPPPPLPGMRPTIPLCNQCNTYHPPLSAGEVCPMAPQKDEGGNVIEFEKFFSQLKNIIIAKMKTRGIKDSKKVLMNIIILVEKYLNACEVK